MSCEYRERGAFEKDRLADCAEKGAGGRWNATQIEVKKLKFAIDTDPPL